MKRYSGWRFALLVLLSLLMPFAAAEDIDIFVGSQGADTTMPNVIFVLDNTSNWARQSQGWPGGLQQGQSEVRAIKNSLANLTGKINVGIVEFTTEGTASQDGGFVRFALQPLTATSQPILNNILDPTIFNDINGSSEKRNANTPYGNLMYDVYNYLGGFGQSWGGVGTNGDRADEAAYSEAYKLFASPLSEANLCGKTYVIFIGNPNSNGPADDSQINSHNLRALFSAAGGTAPKLSDGIGVAPLAIPEISSETVYVDPVVHGFSQLCYSTQDKNLQNSISQCTIDEKAGSLCQGWDNCSCAATTTSDCGGNKAKLQVISAESYVETKATGQEDRTSGAAWNLDDWALLLHSHGVPVTVTYEDGTTEEVRHSVTTYTIDVYNKQPNAEHSGLLYSAAQVGGGRYFVANNEEDIQEAIESTLSDILSVSSTFAAVTLPLSATNRAQNENEVFVGMFRPDQQAKPRWFGNLKKYQVGLFGGKAELADAQGDLAINPTTGFASECSESFWSSDSGSYWELLGVSPAPRSACVSTNNVWSDLPDGPFVEKGGVAQQIREGGAASRSLFTVSGTTLRSLASADFASSTLYDYFRGATTGVGETAAASGTRPSVHGDVIHSRPLPLNYGGTTGTVIYYGANDGLLRAIGTADGAERWALIAPEHLAKTERLHDNAPLVKFPNQDADAIDSPKDYFFDGSIGQIVNYDEDNEISKALIYPTMRRGGRMVYALDVTNPNVPTFLWRHGCAGEEAATCTATDFTDIGQTWSTPRGAYLKGYGAGESPVVMFGGGYDVCEDHTTVSASCGDGTRGKAVYILNAASGALLKKFTTERAVVGDVSVVDVDLDGKVDYAYAADTGGNLYRISFVTGSGTALDPLSSGQWTMEKIAYTSGDNRKFMNTPVVFAHGSNVYIAIGSGNRERPLETDYPYAADVEDRFYMFLDETDAENAEPVNLDSSELNDSSIDPGCTANKVYPGGGSRGWFFDLPAQGEQIVNPAAIAGGDVFFNSYQPGGTQVGMCTRPHGVAMGYQLNLLNGSFCGRTAKEIAGGGMPIAPTISNVRVPCGEGCWKVITVCIGCEGLETTEITPDLDDARSRLYWSSDVDR